MSRLILKCSGQLALFGALIRCRILVLASLAAPLSSVEEERALFITIMEFVEVEEEEERLPTIGDYICPADEYVEEACHAENRPDFLCRPDDFVVEDIVVQLEETKKQLEKNELLSSFDLSKPILSQLKKTKKRSSPNTSQSSIRAASENSKSDGSKSTHFSKPKVNDMSAVMGDLLCQPQSYHSHDKQDSTLMTTFSESHAFDHTVSLFDPSMSIIEEPIEVTETGLAVSVPEQEKAKASPSPMTTKKTMNHAVSSPSPTKMDQVESSPSPTTTLKENQVKATPPPSTSVKASPPGFTKSTIGENSSIKITPPPDIRKTSLLDKNNAAKWSPVKQPRPLEVSPLRENLQNKFKSRMPDPDESPSSSRASHDSKRKLSPLRVKLEEKFKSSPLKGSRPGMEQVLSDFLFNPTTTKDSPWDEAPANDSTLDSLLLATVDESILETTVEKDTFDTGDSSILAVSADMTLTGNHDYEQSYMEEGIERELSVSRIAVDEADVHDVAESEEEMWLALPADDSWQFNGSFLEVALTNLAAEISQEMSHLKLETSMSENPQDMNDSFGRSEHYHVGAILRNMNKYPNRKVLQQHGMKQLLEFTLENPNLIGGVVRAKGIPTILAAMRRYPFERMLQFRGLQTLCNLSGSQANAKALVLQHDGMQVVTDTTSDFSKDAEIVVVACNLTAKLSQVEELKTPIVDAKAIKILADAFDDHKGNREVQKAAREAMTLLLLL